MQQEKIKASFFFTGTFYRNNNYKKIIQRLKKDGHYPGAHSDWHLLYCDWNKRDSLLLTKKQFREDLLLNYAELNNAGIKKEKANYFLPPYELYNDTIAAWTKEMGLQLINYTPGTKSHADYTWPELKNYQSSEAIYNSIINYEQSIRGGLNGFILLLHIGTDARRTDKFYLHLPQLVKYLYAKQYHFQTINELFTVD